MKILNGFSAIFALLLVSVNSQDVESSGKSDFITFFRRIGDILLNRPKKFQKEHFVKRNYFQLKMGVLK